MKIYATKSCGSFATDCKGNFSQFSCFFSYEFCYKRLLESILAIAQRLFYKFNGVWKYNRILSGVANQYPIVMHYWGGGLTNHFPKRVFQLFILILGGPIWTKCYWQVYCSHQDPYELFYKSIWILWMKDSRHNY